jgi:hypothetical protein
MGWKLRGVMQNEHPEIVFLASWLFALVLNMSSIVVDEGVWGAEVAFVLFIMSHEEPSAHFIDQCLQSLAIGIQKGILSGISISNLARKNNNGK